MKHLESKIGYWQIVDESKKNSYKVKSIVISLVCLVLLSLLTFFTIWDHIFNLKPKQETNNSVDYEHLREFLSIGGFVHCFLTQQVIIIFSFLGIFYYFLRYNNIYKTIFVCSISFLIFNLFALTHFRWRTILIDPYFAFQTINVHLITPIIGFILLFIVRKHILIFWQPVLIYSFYLTLFYIQLLCLYYSFTYINKNGEIDYLKVYDFFDFNKKIIIFKITSLPIAIIVNAFLIIISPFVSILCFMITKIIFGLKIANFSFDIKTKYWQKFRTFNIKK